ncbi:MAG: hypothetical protein WAN81_14035 [Candidatus Binataceae bacterium]
MSNLRQMTFDFIAVDFFHRGGNSFVKTRARGRAELCAQSFRRDRVNETISADRPAYFRDENIRYGFIARLDELFARQSGDVPQ